MTFVAAIKKAEGPIPDLRPPKGHIAVDAPDALILNGALAFAFVVLILGRIFRSKQPPTPKAVEPPIVLARRALEAASGPTVIQDCVQIVRRYLFKAYGIGWEGATTSELCGAFAALPLANAETLAALRDYLGASDRALFAPHEAEELAANCVSRSLVLVEQLEARRFVAEPPPLPIAT